MTELLEAGALIHPSLIEIAGAIYNIALAPSNFLYLRRNIPRPKRYKTVTKPFQAIYGVTRLEKWRCPTQCRSKRRRRINDNVHKK